MKAVSILVFALGCQTWECPPLVYTERGIPVHVRPDVEVDPAWVLEWVDLRFEEWVARKAEWNLGAYSDGFLLAAAQAQPIVVYPGHLLPNGFAGYNYYGSRIEIALRWRAPMGLPYDPPVQKNPVDSRGLDAGLGFIGHEWKHTILGDWHP